MSNLEDYIKSLRAKGQQGFTSVEALSVLGISKAALTSSIYRLKKKGELVSVAKDLYISIPPEYSSLGCLPPEELIPILMRHWQLDYYVCLLSAALYHGASHQKPHIYQVMASKQLKSLSVGSVKIDFIYNKLLEASQREQRVVKTGYLTIASPEQTIQDLLQYPRRSGGLNHIATVLSELIEIVDNERMQQVLDASEENAWVQRLGYLLENIDPVDAVKRDQLIVQLQQYLSKKNINFVKLVGEIPKKGYPRIPYWKVIANATIESDL